MPRIRARSGLLICRVRSGFGSMSRPATITAAVPRRALTAPPSPRMWPNAVTAARMTTPVRPPDPRYSSTSAVMIKNTMLIAFSLLWGQVRIGPDPTGISSARHHVAQHVVQDPSVLVVDDLVGGVDAHPHSAMLALAVGVVHLHLDGLAGAEVATESGNADALIAGEFQTLPIVTVHELQRQYAHADQVRPVYALIGFGDDRTHAQQQGAF